MDKKEEKEVPRLAQTIVQFLIDRIGTLVLLLLLTLIVVSVLGYYQNLKWTGLPELIVMEGNGAKTIPGKTLWDWLNLLLIPVILASGALWFRKYEEVNRQVRAKQELDNRIAREKTEKAAAAFVEEQRAQESALEAYLDRMSDLLLDRSLRTSQPLEEVVDIARTRTLTVLRRLNGERKGVVVRFLYEAKLIVEVDEHGNPIKKSLVRIDLNSADLSNANLVGAELPCVDLRGAILIGADLRHANLEDAKFFMTNMDGVKLAGAKLTGATIRWSSVRDADLSYTDLTGADLGNSQLDGAILKSTKLNEAFLPGVSLHDVKGLSCEQLTTATRWQEAHYDEELSCDQGTG